MSVAARERPAPGTAPAPGMPLPITSRPLVVTEPAMQSRVQRATGWLLTLLLWGFWLTLWWPAIRSLACMATGDACAAPAHRFLAWRHAELQLIVVLTVAFTSALVVWAIVQRLRFRHRNRRGPKPVVQVEAIAERHRLDAQALAGWQRERRLVVHHDEAGNLLRVESGWAVPAADDPPPGRHAPQEAGQSA